MGPLLLFGLVAVVIYSGALTHVRLPDLSRAFTGSSGAAESRAAAKPTMPRRFGPGS
ncbi:MAG: hypothetical protein WAT09_08450 [Paracoccaceae bacterium]